MQGSGYVIAGSVTCAPCVHHPQAPRPALPLNRRKAERSNVLTGEADPLGFLLSLHTFFHLVSESRNAAHQSRTTARGRAHAATRFTAVPRVTKSPTSVVFTAKWPIRPPSHGVLPRRRRPCVAPPRLVSPLPASEPLRTQIRISHPKQWV